MSQKELKDEVCDYINHIKLYKQIIIPAELVRSRGRSTIDYFNFNVYTNILFIKALTCELNLYLSYRLSLSINNLIISIYYKYIVYFK